MSMPSEQLTQLCGKSADSNKMKIGYLGPEGSYSHIAALDVFQRQGDLIGAKTVTDLIEDLQKNIYDIAIVPIENSIAGSVNETTDALLRSNDIYITEEYTLDINHCLLAPAQTALNEINSVHAHTMSFGQCRDYLRKHCPNASLELTSSNSQAAEKVSQLNNPKHAAIAPELCAKLYNLTVIAKGINDEANNKTRFWVISKRASPASGKDKTSIVFQTIDEAGSLERILRIFAEAGINLTRIESRPSRTKLGEYSFCLDFKGHKEDDKVNQTLKKAQLYFSYYKWLGSYSSLN